VREEEEEEREEEEQRWIGAGNGQRLGK